MMVSVYGHILVNTTRIQYRHTFLLFPFFHVSTLLNFKDVYSDLITEVIMVGHEAAEVSLVK